MDRPEYFSKIGRLIEERRAVPIAMRVEPLGVSRTGLVVASEFDREAE